MTDHRDREIRTLIRDFVRNQLAYDRPELQIDDELSLVETGIIDSLGTLRTLAYLSEAFAVSVGEEEVVLENFETVNSIVELVTSKLQTGSDNGPPERVE